MKETILIIEDENKIRQILYDYFISENYKVIQACDGREGIEKFEKEDIDLIILDIMMPKLDGWSVCRRIRKNSDIPIIMLTARTDESDELLGFELKVDDYVKKPFSPSVLVARVKTLLNRRNKVIKKVDKKINKGGIIIDKFSREVCINDQIIELTVKEFDILCYLMENDGRALSREQILNSIWGYDFLGDSRVVDNHIKKIRKALKSKSKYIKTVFGLGYKFKVKE